MMAGVDVKRAGQTQAFAGIQIQAHAGAGTQSGFPAAESFENIAAGKCVSGAEAVTDTASSKKAAASSDTLVLRGRTSSGWESAICWGKDILASAGGSGGSVNVKYHQSSTDEEPVVVIWGVNASGKNYESVVHLNEVDPQNASPAEMIALNAHLSKTGNGGAAGAGPMALWTALGANSADTKMDFQRYYEEYIAMQNMGGNHSGAELYRYQLEQILFAHQQNGDEHAWTRYERAV